jgi:hypothetical protein
VRLIVSKITYAIAGDPFLGGLDDMHNLLK